MKKNTYMVAVKVEVVVMPVVYMEVIAKNAKDAVAQVKAMKKTLIDTHRQAILDEFKECVDQDEVLIHKVDSISSAGPANQYHSDAECGLCAKVGGFNKGLHGVDLAEHIRTTLKKCSTVRAIQIANGKD